MIGGLPSYYLINLNTDQIVVCKENKESNWIPRKHKFFRTSAKDAMKKINLDLDDAPAKIHKIMSL